MSYGVSPLNVHCTSLWEGQTLVLRTRTPMRKAPASHVPKALVYYPPPRNLSKPFQSLLLPQYQLQYHDIYRYAQGLAGHQFLLHAVAEEGCEVAAGFKIEKVLLLPERKVIGALSLGMNCISPPLPSHPPPLHTQESALEDSSISTSRRPSPLPPPPPLHQPLRPFRFLQSRSFIE